MSKMFNNCQNLEELPDLSFWETDNVVNMSKMFNECQSLKLLPDISKWKTSHVTDMNSMFRRCFFINRYSKYFSYGCEQNQKYEYNVLFMFFIKLFNTY